jgi:hypothetical protein
VLAKGIKYVSRQVFKPSWSLARDLDTTAEDPSELAGDNDRRCDPGSRAMVYEVVMSGKLG